MFLDRGKKKSRISASFFFLLNFSLTVYSKPYKHFSFSHYTSVGIVSDKRLCFLLKEVGLVLFGRNSAAIALRHRHCEI